MYRYINTTAWFLSYMYIAMVCYSCIIIEINIHVTNIIIQYNVKYNYKDVVFMKN